MNYADFVELIRADVNKAVAYICNPEIEPSVRVRNLEILFKEVGGEIYWQIYDINAFDYGIQGTTGDGQGNMYYTLAKHVSDSIVLQEKKQAEETIWNWLENVVGKAQNDAFQKAKELGKYPSVTRSLRASRSGACEWCKGLVGTHINPEPIVFSRHANCHCKIITRGYKSKNGELKNYKKGSDYNG